MEKVNCILLVDNNQTTTFINQQLIHKLDLAHQIWIAENGQQALGLIEQHYEAAKTYPELVLLDLHMPIMDGLEFFKAFRQFTPEKQTAMKIVVLTTSLAIADQKRAEEIGVEYFINKPLTSQKLKDIWPNQKRKLMSE